MRSVGGSMEIFRMRWVVHRMCWRVHDVCIVFDIVIFIIGHGWVHGECLGVHGVY